MYSTQARTRGSSFRPRRGHHPGERRRRGGPPRQRRLLRPGRGGLRRAGTDVSDLEILVRIADKVGLDQEKTRAALEAGAYAETVRERQALWTSRGITGGPAMVFQEKYLVVPGRRTRGPNRFEPRGTTTVGVRGAPGPSSRPPVRGSVGLIVHL